MSKVLTIAQWGSLSIQMRESLKNKQSRAVEIHRLLLEHYPGLSTFLDHKNSFELLIAVILSAQCTDERVNLTTPALFAAYPDAASMATAPLEHLKELIKSINFFNNKSQNIKRCAQQLIENHEGQVPNTLEALTALAGVGRKTANVILGQAFDIPGITVDTHVKRLSNRLGFTKHSDAVKAEKDLMKIWPANIWNTFSTTLIYHGRQQCPARSPKCSTCFLTHLCPKKGLKN